MEEELSEVFPREFLCCPLCREEYQDPIYLPCLHSFCKACIDFHIRGISSNNGVLLCPVCSTEIRLPSGESWKFPENTFTKRLSCPRTVERKRDRQCDQCRSSGETNEAKTHCLNCDEFLCDKCANNHLDQKETASHKSQKIDSYKDDDEIKLASGPQSPALPQCCPLYDSLDIGSMYCVDCEILLCGDCHNKLHSQHRCAELSAVSQNFENKIEQPLQELKKDKHSLDRALVSLENVKNFVQKKHGEIINQIKERTKVLCGLIQEYENMLVLEVEKRHVQNLDVIQEREDAIQKHAQSINVVIELTEKLLAFGSEEEKVSMRRHIGRRVRELCEVQLPTKHVRLVKSSFNEPPVTVETICEMFGVLTKDGSEQGSNRKVLLASHSTDLEVINTNAKQQSTSSTEEISDLEEYEELDTDMLSISNTSDALCSATSTIPGSGAANDDQKMTCTQPLEAPTTDSIHQLTLPQMEVPCHNLETAKREMCFPDTVSQDCIKGIGVNSKGDIIVGTVSASEGSKVFILEKHGIVRGQIPVERNWMIHSIAADGKVSLIVPRSDNRYKVKVMSGENNIDILVDAHIESFGLNSVTATKSGTLLVAASRYPTARRSAKYGGNITMYDQEGTVLRVITNETFANLHVYLFDRPHSIATDLFGNFFVADPGRHSVTGFKADGELMFEYGNTDVEEELYQGPDAICTDHNGNVVVYDKKDSRIDILDYDGHLLRCYFPCEHIRFVCVTPDRALMLVNSEGKMKFYDYM